MSIYCRKSDSDFYFSQNSDYYRQKYMFLINPLNLTGWKLKQEPLSNHNIPLQILQMNKLIWANLGNTLTLIQRKQQYPFWENSIILNLVCSNEVSQGIYSIFKKELIIILSKSTLIILMALRKCIHWLKQWKYSFNLIFIISKGIRIQNER